MCGAGAGRTNSNKTTSLFLLGFLTLLGTPLSIGKYIYESYINYKVKTMHLNGITHGMSQLAASISVAASLQPPLAAERLSQGKTLNMTSSNKAVPLRDILSGFY